jgi:uncharacterized protein (UPF0264 family)
MTALLVSVRSAAEAEAAMAGGATLIDVKEATRGPLGRADDAIITAVIRAVAGRRPVSAALGELSGWDGRDLPASAGDLAFLKWGPAGYSDSLDWYRDFTAAVRRVAEAAVRARVVAVAYADWQRAQAPSPADVFAWSLDLGIDTFLLDTWGKDGTTLLDWLNPAAVREWCRRCRDAGGRVALAGSLGPDEIRPLLPLRPDWFAVRGAACRERDRSAAIEESRVRQLVELVEDGRDLRRGCP